MQGNEESWYSIIIVSIFVVISSEILVFVNCTLHSAKNFLKQVLIRVNHKCQLRQHYPLYVI